MSSLINQIYTKWASHAPCHVLQTPMLCFCDEKYHAHMLFHESISVMELVIENKETKENEFYLHFEVHDSKMADEAIQAFFNYLHKPADKPSYSYNVPNLPKRIAVVCSSGFTSSYFAMNLKETARLHHLSLHIEGMSISTLEDVIDQYDLVLLTFQVAHHYKRLFQRYGNKIKKLEVMDFATGNTWQTLQSLSH